MRDGQLAEKKAALSKALSAAYLEHQIADLESRVNAIGVDDKAGAAGGGGGGAGAANNHNNNKSPTRRAWGAAAAAAPTPAPAPAPAPQPQPQQRRIDESSASDSEPEADGWRVAVVDVSALMWAPKSVRRLVQRGYEVVVPLDAVRTLDMLKKGSAVVAQSARAATRYVEHASRHWRPVSADPSLAVQAGTHYKKGRGLRLQRDDESAPPPAAAMAGDMPPPKWVASVLGCAAYFTTISRAEEALNGLDDEPRPAVLIAHPPLSAEVGPPPVDERADAAPAQQHNLAERAEGYTVSLEAGRFELGLEVLRDDDDDEGEVEAVGRRGGRGRRAPGGGEGRGGRGRRGRNREHREAARDEPEREVKILLRRPVEESDVPTPVTPQRAEFGSAPASPTIPNGEHDEPRERERSHRGGGRRGRGGGGGGGERGRGRGRGGGNADRGGGFTLLQRPGPPLAHHVRNIDPSGRQSVPSQPPPPPPPQFAKRGGGAFGAPGQGRPMPSQPSAEFQPWPRRGAYASADADAAPPPGQRVVLLQRPS
ncbi:uncharacterized protein LOC62_06G008710 [Vanrija pseudolonga]|uniref:PIN domain-containing protein n=1 Tax=Vanrija pseudolonga TaxID=143232 RepID=A0AAF1BKY1_9TREE|nr:hypothetical protein LOC62_06G008710 [Vanrija pseudolonga]